MSEELETRIIGNKESKYIIYTADGTEFYLDEFSEYSASGTINGDNIKFHPENIIAVRTRKDPT
jgi:hypothetical protein